MPMSYILFNKDFPEDVTPEFLKATFILNFCKEVLIDGH